MSETRSGADRLEGQVALVTGVSSGLGRAVAFVLAGGGASVALVARSEADLRDTQEEVSATGRQSLILPTDLADEAETRGLSNEASRLSAV